MKVVIKPREYSVIDDPTKNEFLTAMRTVKKTHFLKEYGKTIGEIIHVREVLPGRTDTERLDFITNTVEKKSIDLLPARIGKWYVKVGRKLYKLCDSPREAIDDAMDGEQKNEN